MDKVIEYAPIVTVLIMFFIQYKIFVTPQQLTELKVNLIEYITENYVHQNTYNADYGRIERRIDSIDSSIKDLHNLMLSLIKSVNNDN